MSAALLYLPCVPNINWLQNFARAESVYIEQEENFVKSTYRNRYEIAGANGKQVLSIPLQGGRDKHRLYKETRIAYTGHWPQKHWQAIISAYGSAPFFEFYAYKFAPVFEKEYEFLFEFNLALLKVALTCLKLPQTFELTTTYEKEPAGLIDLRSDKTESPTQYYQGFADRNGFIPNLSALDLIFNEGTRSGELLKP